MAPAGTHKPCIHDCVHAMFPSTTFLPSATFLPYCTCAYMQSKYTLRLVPYIHLLVGFDLRPVVYTRTSAAYADTRMYVCCDLVYRPKYMWYTFICKQRVLFENVYPFLSLSNRKLSVKLTIPSSRLHADVLPQTIGIQELFRKALNDLLTKRTTGCYAGE